ELRRRRDLDLLPGGCQVERKVEHRRAPRSDRDLLDGRRKAGRHDFNAVLSHRDGVELELTVRVRLRGAGPVRGPGVNRHPRALDRAMLGIVHDSAEVAKYGRPQWRGQYQPQRDTEANRPALHESPPQRLSVASKARNGKEQRTRGLSAAAREDQRDRGDARRKRSSRDAANELARVVKTSAAGRSGNRAAWPQSRTSSGKRSTGRGRGREVASSG